MSEKPNPLVLKRPSRTIRDLKLTDSNHPGLEVNFRLRALDTLDVTNANVLVTEMANKYIYGSLPFPAIDGEVPKLNIDLLQAVCTLYTMQCGEEEDKFTPEEFIAFSVTTPEIWVALLNALEELTSNSVWGKALEMIFLPAGSS